MKRKAIVALLAVASMLGSGCANMDNEMSSSAVDIPDRTNPYMNDTVQTVNPPTPEEHSSYQEGTHY